MTSNDNKDTKKSLNVQLSALFPFEESNLITGEEKEIRGQDYIQFGTDNKYPQYIFDLYETVPTLGSIINSVVDYAAGDGVEVKDHILFGSEAKTTDFLRNIFLDLAVYGGCYINVLRSKLGNVARLAVLDYRHVRSDKDNKLFYYSPDFTKKSYGRCKYTCLPAFDPENKTQVSSIYYIKTHSKGTYARPIWAQAQVACELEKVINEFSLNEVNNGFASNVVINMNNGRPTDEVQKEIVDMFTEKYTGYQNAARPVVTFNEDKDHAPTIDKLNVDNFNERYAATQERAKQQILTAWRCNGNLVGIPTAQGFNSEEYQSSYNLFYKTVVKPIQNRALIALEEITGKPDGITINPFTIDFGNNE